MSDTLRVNTRRLSPAQQQVLRMRVIAAIQDGISDAEAAKTFGVSRNSIRTWRARFEAGGVEGLVSGRPGRKAGEHTRLTPAEEAALVDAMIDFEPEDLGVGGKLWTRKKVVWLAHQLFGVWFTEQGMGRLFRRLGLTFQRPDKRAIEANPEAMKEWTDITFPAIRAKASAEGGVVLFGDQVGVRSQHLTGRTWGRKGQTPVVKRAGKRFDINAMSAISTRGEVRFTVFRDGFNSDTMIQFLERLIRQFDQKIHLTLDRHSVHRSKDTRKWLEDHAGRIQVHFLPPYTPHLNPDELVNADLKRTLADQQLTNLNQMEAAVRSFFRSIQKRKSYVLTYFQAPHTKYTCSTI